MIAWKSVILSVAMLQLFITNNQVQSESTGADEKTDCTEILVQSSFILNLISIYISDATVWK